MNLTDDLEQIKAMGHVRHFAVGEDLLREGDQAQSLFYIEQGAVRLWHNDDGRDITLQFFFEEQAVASFESFYLKTPSLFAITAIEPTTVQVIDGNLLRQRLQTDPEMIAAFTDHIAHRFIDYMQYFLNRIEQSQETRYRSLLVSDPALVKRVPQSELATYLGITPVSLSRIRNRVKKDQAN
ncbi:Crp/Fnr family transcriptional regulator [Lacticaseibacillus porcinae]|uniref:Crp/Fnr family transcriptional regulator n=1 Tax=Lacticaseibacillus porcinae TaxID=1123687 RepID=UPI000F774BC2|nr:Crp/Fnr family transcriptional regulator [Lacticaseibacillus porcinae]